MIADSSGCEGAKPAFTICAALGALPQSSLVAMMLWSEERTRVSVGLASGLAMPNAASDGPVPVITTVFDEAPPITNPAIVTLLPVCTLLRVEMFTRRGGVVLNVAATLTGAST